MMTFLLAAPLCPRAVHAQSLTQAQYTTTPPFVSNTAPKNILLVLDNSGSMQFLAAESGLPSFDPTTTYYGLFDPAQCYQYTTGSVELFKTGSSFSKSASNDCPDPTHPWDGNVLNYVSMRRIDVAKWVMTGGKCDGARDSTGNCSSGRVVGTSGDASSGWRTRSASIPEALLANRVDASFLPGTGTAWFHSPPVVPQTGIFCIDGIPGPTGTGIVGLPVSACNGVTQFQVRVEFLTEPTGVIQQTGIKARFGLMVYNRDEGGRVIVEMGDNLGMLTQIDNTIPSGWTPLAETLYEAIRYFAQLPPVYNQSGPDYTVTPAKDPYYFQPPWVTSPQYVNCCQSYVIIFTDGQPTQDRNIPAALQNYAGPANAHYPVPDHNNVCSAYYGGFFSDPCGGNGSHFLDDVAYWAHTTDLRQATVPVINEAGNDLPGMQNLKIYTFFAYGSGSLLLADTAKVGGFDNGDGNNNPNPTMQACTYPIGSSLGAGISTSSPKWDANQDCIPDAYFEATSGKDMRDQMANAISNILAGSASGTGVSIVGASSSGEGAFYQSYFVPKVDASATDGTNEIRWLGYTQSLFVDTFGHFREDTNGDGRLVYNQDKIVVPRFDASTNSVKIDRYSDADSDGLADFATPDDTVDLTSINPVWEAGRRLALTDPDSRRILTWVDTNNNGAVDIGEMVPFISTNAGILAQLDPFLLRTAPLTAANIIDFVRGNQVPGLRDRVKKVKNDAGINVKNVWKFGDIVNSSPVVVAAPMERFDIIYGDATYVSFYQQYKDRRQVVYVGANDGMLHAFNGGFYTAGDDPATPALEHGRFNETASASVSAKYSSMRTGSPKLGAELWGFIPYQLLPQLQWLTRPDYAHVDYVDLPPKVTDARIFTPDADHPNGWGTILIGGMRFGGSCGACADSTGGVAMTFTANFDGTGNQTRTFYSAYFVLDITNPEKDPVLLWSFTDPRLGLTSSRPAVLRVSPRVDPNTDNTNARWFMAVGSGVTSYDGASTQTGTIFVVDLATGRLDGAFSTGDANASMGDVITVDVELDYRVNVIYLGSSINNSPNSPQFIGKLYRLTTEGCNSAPCTTSTWGIAGGGFRVPTVLLAKFPPGNTRVGPVTAAPAVSIDNTDAIWVYWGTGRYYTDSDQTNTDTQYLFGVKDAVVTGGCSETSVMNCQQNNLLNMSSAVVCTVCITLANQVTGVAGVTSFAALEALVENMDGWYTTLSAAGERSLSRPTILGHAVFFTTFIPTTGDICKSAGNGNLYGLFYNTGSASKNPVLGTSTAGPNTIANSFITLGAGLPSQLALQVGSQGSGSSGALGSHSGCSGRMTGYVQASTSATGTVCTNPDFSPWSRLINWRDL